ncbi:MAG: hypothetical protein M1268_01275 [Patescibacteria group bacterium]|nr:hypothetical protein [Patescibacteria group bacterium]
MGKELCFDCQILKECWFRKEVDRIKAGIGKKGEGAEEAHVKIASLRIEARDIHNCPRVNYTPRFRGRKNL